MKKKSLFSLVVLLLILVSCNEVNKRRPNSFAPKIIETKGYVVAKDSMSEPKAILAGNPTIVKVGSPEVIPANTNIYPAGKPTIVLAGVPRVSNPGQDTFHLPKILPVIGTKVTVGNPEVVIAKDAYIKDQNPQCFSSFSKLQGLKHDVTRCMLQDKNGNLWFGMEAGGVTKYDGKYFTHFTDKEGLSNNTVLSMLEDKNGNLWFGTNGGVSKYDGQSFTHFTEKEGLPNNTIRSILEDKKGNLWFGTYAGVSKYDGKLFTHFTEKEGLCNNTVLSILEDKSGNLWFGTDDGGVSKYNGKSFSHYTEKEGLSNNTILAMLEDKSGSIWFGTKAGVCKFDGVSFTHFTEKEGLSNNNVRYILEDKKGNIWLGTYGGISKYDGKSFTHFAEKEGLPSNTVRCILEDKNRNLWFGTSAGVSKYDGKSLMHYTEREGLSNSSFYSSLKDKSGNLWFGGDDGSVSKYDGQTFSHFAEKQGLFNVSVLSMLEDKRGNLWFGFEGVGLAKYDGTFFTFFTEKQGLSNDAVMSMLQDKNGNLWFGTISGGVSKYDGKSFTHFTEKEGLSNNTVLSMLEDKQGNLWFGTKGGVNKYDGKSFTHFTEKEGLSNNNVRSMLEDENGNLWFGTYYGVNKYDGKSFTHFTEKEGLSNNTVLSMIEDQSGNLWFGTRFGLSKLSSKTKKDLIFFSDGAKSVQESEVKVVFKNYTYEDGFLGIGVNAGKTICEDKNGSLWIGANDRLTAYHPEGEFSDGPPPNIQLTSVELFNENISWVNFENKKDTSIILGNGVSVGNFEFDGIKKWYNIPENLSLQYNNNYLTFNFIGITQKSSKKVKYLFKLEGIDENWSAITDRTEAAYGNIPQGNYTFKVKAMNSEGNWSNECSYEFTIRPPWWKTWWFRSVAILLVIGSIVFYIKWRERALKERQKKLEQTVEERTAEVVEQKQIIEEKHKEITDSINYAERIQRSFLATEELLNDNLKDHFVFFQPKDVVSGDFYWASKLSNGNFALVTADSTGHGVPGAIMSILNISCLEKSVEEEKIVEPAEIFNHTRLNIIKRLKKDGSAEGGKDGMDASLICFDFNNSRLTYAAANNPVWIARSVSINGLENSFELIELAPDKMPVGKGERDSVSFTQHIVDLQKGDVVYALTDGFPDQFGGPKGKKYMYKQLKQLLISIAHLPMLEQREILKTSLNNWKGNMEQVDDICLIGVRI